LQGKGSCSGLRRIILCRRRRLQKGRERDGQPAAACQQGNEHCDQNESFHNTSSMIRYSHVHPPHSILDCHFFLWLPLWLPVWFRVVCNLAHARSIGTHDKYISLIVISQRVEGDPLTIRGEGARSFIASVGELDACLCRYIDEKDVFITCRAGINQEMRSIW